MKPVGNGMSVPVVRTLSFFRRIRFVGVRWWHARCGRMEKIAVGGFRGYESCMKMAILMSMLLVALLQGGCETPVLSGTATGAKDLQNVMVGYEKTTYEYPVKVPGTNRWVKIISPEPIDRPLTYDDYLLWQEHGDEALLDPASVEEAQEAASKQNAPNRR